MDGADCLRSRHSTTTRRRAGANVYAQPKSAHVPIRVLDHESWIAALRNWDRSKDASSRFWLRPCDGFCGHGSPGRRVTGLICLMVTWLSSRACRHNRVSLGCSRQMATDCHLRRFVRSHLGQRHLHHLDLPTAAAESPVCSHQTGWPFFASLGERMGFCGWLAGGLVSIQRPYGRRRTVRHEISKSFAAFCGR